MASLLLTTPPALEPLSLGEAKAHLRVEHDTDNALIAALIETVRDACEQHTGRALITQGWRMLVDRLDGDTLAIPHAPVQQVTAIASLDAAGAATPFSLDAIYLVPGTPARLALRDGASWPAVLRRVGGIRVDYTVGYGQPDDIPAALRQGMLQHLAALYTRRGDSDGVAIPPSALALFQPYRLLRLA